MAEKGRLAQ